jgi:hypothetical protein
MSNSIIFLDCDGVIATSRCMVLDFEEGDASLFIHPTKSTQVPLEVRTLRHLQHVVARTGSRIVLTTTWRADPEMRDFLIKGLASQGMEDVVIDDTWHLPEQGRGTSSECTRNCLDA